MNPLTAIGAVPGKKKMLLVITILAATFIVITLFTDMLRSSFQHSGFYLSESLLFNSFWLIFPPLMFLQFRVLAKQQLSKWSIVLTVLAPVVLHILFFPLLVSLFSALFYYHTYDFFQTLQYTITEDIYKLLFGYGCFAFFIRLRVNRNEKTPADEIETRNISVITIQQGRKYITIAVDDIFYLKASTPYITLHLGEKQYLYNQTLKSIHNQLESSVFVRVHRSAIVNINKVTSWKSRLNGDYDITLKNGEELRLSRNYVARFRQALGKPHSA